MQRGPLFGNTDTGRLYGHPDVEIRSLAKNAVEGIYLNKYYFVAHVYPQGSPAGLKQGRVKKLFICDALEWNVDKTLFSYDGKVTKDNPMGYAIAAILDFS